MIMEPRKYINYWASNSMITLKMQRLISLIHWLDSILHRIGNISAIYRQRLLIKSDQFGNFEVTLAALTSLLFFVIQWTVFCVPRGCYPWHGAPFNVPLISLIKCSASFIHLSVNSHHNFRVKVLRSSYVFVFDSQERAFRGFSLLPNPFHK